MIDINLVWSIVLLILTIVIGGLIALILWRVAAILGPIVRIVAYIDHLRDILQLMESWPGHIFNYAVKKGLEYSRASRDKTKL